MSDMKCQKCSSTHACWSHKLGGCKQKHSNSIRWAPSECKECILALLADEGTDDTLRAKAMKDYRTFYKGTLSSFVNRVSVVR